MGEAPLFEGSNGGISYAYPAWMAMIWRSHLTIQHGSAWPTLLESNLAIESPEP